MRAGAERRAACAVMPAQVGNIAGDALREWHMRLSSVLSVLLPVLGLTLLGFRTMGRRWRTMREVSQLRSLGRPQRRASPAKR